MQTSISDNESVPPAIVSWDEVRIGKLIATGAFSAVYCTDKKDNWSSSSTSLNFDESLSAMFFEDDLEDVLTKATQGSESEFGDPSHSSSDPSLVSEDSRLVLKCLNKSSRSGKTHKAMATRGLINEASILMSLAPHPNVTRLVGVSNDLLHANPDKGFLVFDRIADSLDRILVRWQICPDDQDLSLFGPDIQWKETDLWKQSPLHWRLKHIVLGMVKGLAFLHKNSVLHRDFKPSNVGISYDGTVRILDLGSARRLPVPGGFELTKGVGTRRYMAPEVDRSSRAPDYGYPADVFSFSIVFWEVLTQRKAFDEFRHLTRLEIKHAMYIDKERPRLDLDACAPFRDALLCGWDHEPSVRPTISDMISRIEAELAGDGPLECWQPDEQLRRPSKLYFL
ncbi:hypothetical protein FisN_11Hh188 [Fistulifera solaris]|uniref:Protein kinase domain-containing protein n=1 Tax=Fistulifera solaris TaxID=1519565 RepID=A0A1Z5JK22_FISSO|nr:hypothetical protein FisN_11Hh188 [Fistulifera solaris]|eukprot:GAX14355.1 hypothetical protein FisN_11Hh188 [Fistulifera solaris]